MSVETGFEQKFGQLVDAHLNEKLPSLTNYRIGFQVIDKTEEEDRAVGIAAFIVNDVWLYIPVFFLKGDLRGSDLIYVKQRDIFVPAVDNWISTISEKGLEVLGHGQDDTERADMFAAPEDTNVYQSSSDFGKAASFGPNSLFTEEEILDMRKSYKEAGLPINLKDELEDLGPTASKLFATTVMKNVKYANALFTHYTDVEVEDMLRGCIKRYTEHEKVASEASKLIFITDIHQKEAADLGDTEKGLLLRNDVYVRDTRTNFSKVYEEQVNTGIIQNPAGPGIYDVYMQNGDYKTYIVLMPKCFDQDPSLFRMRQSNVSRPVCLVDVDNPSKYVRKKSHEVFCKPSTNITESDVKGLQGGKKASLRSLRDLPIGSTLLFVTSPENSLETELVGRQSDGNGGLIVAVSNTTGNSNKSLSLNSSHGQIVVEFTGQKGRLKVAGDHLFVPEHTRVFVRAPESKEDRVALGTPETVYQVMHKQAGLKRIELFAGDNTLQVKTASSCTPLLSRVEGLRHLTEDHGIFAGQAMQLIKRASRETKGHTSFLIKHAGPFDSGAYGNSEKPFLGGPTAAQENGTTETRQAGSGAALTGARASDNSMLPGQAVDKATKASQAGIKEVFDVSVLSGLIDKTDISELRKDYLKDMIRGMDKVGRMMFLFYWHRDEFEDRYGDEDLQKLEDTLQNVFTSIGDLVLFLKNKTAYSPESAETLFGSLSEDVASA